MVRASTFSAAALMRRPVTDAHGISIGLTADVLADRSLAAVLGFDVEAPRERAFLPFAACSIGDGGDEITVASALSLLGAAELEYYESHGISLARLRSTSAGADLLLDEGGRIAAVMLEPQQSEVLDDVASGRASDENTMAFPLQRR